MTSRSLLPLACLAALSCGEPRSHPDDFKPAKRASYRDDIAPLLASKCTSCHSGTNPTGRYDLTSWRGIFGGGRDGQRNVVAGDGNSRLLTIFADDQEHGKLLDQAELERLTRWVVQDRLAYFGKEDAGYHAPGWVDPSDRSSTHFHGGMLRSAGWNMTSCEKCHGVDLNGGKSGVSCTTCHAGGARGCTTCHGDGDKGSPAPPSDLMGRVDSASRGVGVHRVHLEATQGVPVACSECHLVPKALDYVKGHLFDDDGGTDFRAEVVFGPLAKGKPRGLDLKPSYDPKTGTCQNVYCHFGDGAKISEWVWNKRQGNVGCDSCHGYPPEKTRNGTDHAAATACEGCHLKAYKDGKRDPATHINGKVEVFGR